MTLLDPSTLLTPDQIAPVRVGDFQDFKCPNGAIVIADPPYGLGKVYNGQKEQTPFRFWADRLVEWSQDSAAWLLIFGPYPTMQEWLHQVRKPSQILMWHRTFVQPTKGLHGWLPSLTPILVYNFGRGEWYGPTRANTKEWSDTINSHSSMGDIRRQIALGLHKRFKAQKHPAMTGTQIAKKLLIGVAAEDDLVVDPMAGCGSLLVGAQAINCQVAGTEIVPEWAGLANEWLTMELERRK